MKHLPAACVPLDSGINAGFRRCWRRTLRSQHSFARRCLSALLAASVACFSSLPAAIAQQANLPATTPVTTADLPPTTRHPTIPPPTAAQGEKARALFQKGVEAFKAQQSKRAMKYFAQAEHLDRTNGAYIAAYEIARQQQIGGAVQGAKTAQQAGQEQQARQKLMAALSLDPDNQYVKEHLESLDTGTSATQEPEVVRAFPEPQFSSGVVELEPAPIQATFHLKGPAQQVIPQVFRAYGILPILDDSVPKTDVRIDLTNANFDVASKAIQLTTGTFLVPLDPEHVVVAKDTKQNRATFQRLLLETIFLPGLDSKEMAEPVNLIKTVFGVRQVSTRPGNGTISIRAPEETLRAINATLSTLYLNKPEVMLDIRVYQVNDSRQEDLGVAFPQSLTVFNVTSQISSIISQNQSTIQQLIASGLVNPGDLAGIAALLVGLGLVNGTILNQPFALFGNGLTLSGLSFGSTTANASLNISNTRELDHIQLRASDSQKESFLLGSKYPVVTQSYSAGTQTPTSFTSLSSLISGSAQSNLGATNPLALAPTVTYLDLGLTLKAMVHVLQNRNIQMQLQVKLASLSGGNVNGNPIVDNRSFTTAIQVPDGGSALMTSSVSTTESRALTGIPGLSELPGFAWTASPTTQLTVGRLLIVISPHIVSRTHFFTASRQFPVPAASATP